MIRPEHFAADAPLSEHLPPLTKWQRRCGYNALDFIFVVHARHGVLIGLRRMIGSEENIPNRKERCIVSIMVLADATVVNSMKLRIS